MASSFPEDWQILPVADCMESIIDYRGKTPKKSTSGIPLVTAKIVKGGRIDTPNEFILPEDYDKWMTRGLPQAGDVVLTTEAPLGEVAQLDNRKVALAQRLITLRGDKQLLDNTYLKFFLLSDFGQNELQSRATGTTVLGIKQSELRRAKIIIPPLPEQRAIAQILGSLDEKIELNRRLNATLEEMARALFRSWFVDFDPVRAKAAGVLLPGLSPDLAALFPATFDQSTLGPIPQGWRVGKLGDLAQNVRQSVNPENLSPKTAYIGLEHMPRGCIALSEWGCAENLESGKFAFSQGDILFGKLRPYFRKVGIAPIDGVCSTDILVIQPSETLYAGIVLLLVASQEFIDFTDAGSGGTRMPRTNWADMANYGLPIPPNEIVTAFNEHIESFTPQIQANIYQSRALAQLRDALLPELLSGRLRVPDAEAWVEARRVSEAFNIYCDESGHLENDGLPLMVLGAVWCPAEKRREIAERIREIKAEYEMPPGFEMKWSKVSPAGSEFYRAILDYFLDDDDLHFRALVAHKAALDHNAFGQTHDDWYYKMYFIMLQALLRPHANYRIYLDYKDTQGVAKVRCLHDVLCNSMYDFDHRVLQRVQTVHSFEVEQVQLADLLVGAVAYANRELNTNAAKVAFVQRLRQRTRYSLTRNTLLLEQKCNIFHWRGRGATG